MGGEATVAPRKKKKLSRNNIFVHKITKNDMQSNDKWGWKKKLWVGLKSFNGGKKNKKKFF